MGDPKKPRKKYDTSRFPWQTDTLQSELRLIGEYGLRNKKEFWRYRTMVSKFRGIARSLLGMSSAERRTRQKQLLSRLRRLGVLSRGGELDDVLDLTTEELLERRLQSLVFHRGLAKSMHQARQFIVHGHVAVGGKRVSSPGYLVSREEESEIDYAPNSPLSDSDHPVRESIGVEGEAA
ncbi:30S ribosomal protein S4 [Candidatus Bathyarchaeota archaeon]|nr:30S ribosomal protein S4 [Candidatus Bathyarchaeota archaeon]NIU81557.1 30S ribosomal protein S4 [Candidatus Bathyarchaeota archaeon]NIV68193.1 30S ribosomal protein S4 [Candidatus Bathyarchaeota archaeon]NIW16575.1 30S ribosomal protein S4 [Candidatus Bathyarchaeota archaeon]NIW34794.1 30S ribosomal protein S4 [Candidatus Bathyarchaeota archaeon]